jgi:glycosyltransferase involved in cell wall biosynthesis
LQRDGELFLCVSDDLRRRAVALGFPPHRTRVHYIGVDPVRYGYTAEPGSQVVLHVARLVPKKGTARLIEAFERMSGQHPAARLVVVGDGPLRTQLEAQARSGASARRITFLGALPNAQVVVHLRRAALLAVPSVTAADGDVEGLPISLLEAMSTGVPVVASAHGGIPEAVVDGETGFLVKEGDAAHLSRRMSQVLADDRLRREMSQAGRARVLEKFDIRANTRALEAVYDEVLAAAS